MSKILMIEDDLTARVLMNTLLSGAGHTVLEADSLSRGERLAQEVLPHLILLDLNLTDGSGFQFLEKRLEDPVLSQIPVAVVSGSTAVESVQRALRLMANDYVVKPIDARVFLNKVSRLTKKAEGAKLEFSPSLRPKAEISLAAKITAATEMGFMLEVPARLDSGVQVDLQSSWLTSEGLDAVALVRSKRPSKMKDQTHYFSEVITAGLPPEVAERLRKRSGT